MKIIVCTKQIYHTYARTGLDPDKLFIAPEDTVPRINPYDEAALEIALCFKDVQPETEIVILTLGPLIAEAELRRCLAMGADNIYQIDIDGGMDPQQKSEFLATAVKKISADIILCGKESLDTQNGQIGALLAHKLGMPFVSAVLEFKLKNNQAEALKSVGRGMRERVLCPLPAVFSVDLGQQESRLPTYMAKKKAQSFQIKKMSYSESEINERKLYSNVSPPRPRPKKVPAPDSSMDSYNRIEQLLTGSRVEKKGTVLRGSPDSQADGIFSFLEEHCFLQAGKDKKNA